MCTKTQKRKSRDAPQHKETEASVIHDKGIMIEPHLSKTVHSPRQRKIICTVKVKKSIRVQSEQVRSRSGDTRGCTERVRLREIYTVGLTTSSRH